VIYEECDLLVRRKKIRYRNPILVIENHFRARWETFARCQFPLAERTVSNYSIPETLASRARRSRYFFFFLFFFLFIARATVWCKRGTEGVDWTAREVSAWNGDPEKARRKERSGREREKDRKER